MAKKGTSKNKSQDAKTIEKALRVGLGLLSLGGEKVSDLMDELAKRGAKYSSRTDAAVSKIATTVSEKSEALKTKGGEASDWMTKRGGEASDWVSKEVKTVIKRVNFATREDLKKLQAEVDALKKLVGKKKPAKKPSKKS